MTKKEVKNIGASVKTKLMQLAKNRSVDFNSILLQYLHERFLYRLSISDYKENFILKGALSFLAYEISRLRPTKDIDFLGRATANDLENIKNIMKIVSETEYIDGVTFNSETITLERIKEDAEYEGVRVKIKGNLGTIKQKIQLDIGFGDIIVDGPKEINFPVLLEFPSPNIKVYSKESMIAEKFQAIVFLNYTTSRLKDFYDIFFLASSFSFDLKILKEAVNSTFTKRETPLSDRQVVFSDQFKNDKNKNEMWDAFLKRLKIDSNLNFEQIMQKIKVFLEPVFIDDKGIWNPELWRWE